MLWLVAPLVPLVLLFLLLLMEHVEAPLHAETATLSLEEFLDTARPEELEVLVSEGFAPALERYWRRRRRIRLVPGLH